LNSPSPVAKPFPESTARAKGPRVFLDYNHFEIAETLVNPYGRLSRAVLTQLGLERA